MLSRKEANALLEIVDAGLRSKGDEDFRKLVLNLQDLVPFEFALCSLASISYRSADPYRMINVSYPHAWIDRYISEGLDMVDPVVVEHRLHFDLQYWSDSYEKHPEARQFIMSASDYGLKTGYSYGLKTQSGDGASPFSFGGKSMERSRRTFHILRRIVPHLHQALVRIVAPLDHLQEVTYGKLSPRERKYCSG